MTLAWAFVRECLTRGISPIRLVSTDPLTGTFDRYSFEIWGRRIKGVCHIAVDLDGFKHVNDTLGHPARDAVLASVGRILQRHDRRVFRLGGDEFVLLAQPYEVTLRRIARNIVDEVAASNLRRHCLGRQPPQQPPVPASTVGLVNLAAPQNAQPVCTGVAVPCRITVTNRYGEPREVIVYFHLPAQTPE